MPTEIRCPSCNRQLKVPDNLLGKTVRCPGCQQTFTAAAESPAAPSPVQPRPSAPAPRPRLPADDEADEGIQEEAPVRRSRPAAEEYEEVGDEAYDEDEDRPRRRRGSNAVAASQVSGPAIALMVLGILNAILALVNLAINLLGAGMAAGNAGPKGAGQDPFGGNEAAFRLALGVPSNVIGLIFAGLILFGAIRMKNLQSYGMALTASILAVIPCFGCCLLGIPFGIWGIVTLSRPEVKDAFT